MLESTTIPDSRLRPMQIISLALPAGVVLFALVAVVLLGSLRQPPAGPLISLLGAGFAAMMVVARFVLPNLLFRPQVPEGETLDVDSACNIYQTRLIVALALLEGAAFFNLVALILEHHWWSLAIAGGLVLLMLGDFPTRTRIQHWIETQRLM